MYVLPSLFLFVRIKLLVLKDFCKPSGLLPFLPLISCNGKNKGLRVDRILVFVYKAAAVGKRSFG